jgi:hypothetical protein
MGSPSIARSVYLRTIDWFWPTLACVWGWKFIIKNFNAQVLYDSEHTYLPAALAFLEKGWTFLLTPESYRVVPLGYLWPALWGANPNWIRAGNMGLWAACVWFLWRASYLLAGHRAAMVSMLLLMCSDLQRYFPSEMTEPIYLFGVLGLIHALARLIICKDQMSSAVVQCAAMLSITLLSRPILQLIAPIALLAGLAVLAVTARSAKQKKTTDRAWRATVLRTILGLGLGLIIPAALIVKNGWAFGLWGLGTGSGTGLYLGTHPIFQGTEPAFLGFDYDINDLIRKVTHYENDTLSLVGDRIARQAAWKSLQTMSASDALVFFGRKLWWWLAYHPCEIKYFHIDSLMRKRRLFELSVLIVGCFGGVWHWRRSGRRPNSPGIENQAMPLTFSLTSRQWAFAATLLIILVLLIVQLLPILYNARYSSALLDPWLMPLTGCGLAWMTGAVRLHGTIQKNKWFVELTASDHEPIVRSVILLSLVMALTLIVYQAAEKLENTAVNVRYTGPLATLFQTSDEARVHTTGMAMLGARTWVVTESPAALMVDLNKEDIEQIKEGIKQISKVNPVNALWDTDIALQTVGRGKCRYAEISYRTSDGRILQPLVRLPLLLPLKVDGQFHQLLTNANQELRPGEMGSLRTVLHCSIGTMVKWNRTAFFESRYSAELAEHIKPPTN